MRKISKAQTGKKVGTGPTYKNLPMGVRNEQYLMSGQYKDVKPTSKDSARYRSGYEQGLKGMKGLPNEGQIEKMGRWEGQNANKPKKKGKVGIKVAKAQTGKSLPPVTVSSSTMNRGKKTIQTSPGGAYKMKTTMGPTGDTTRQVERRTLKGVLTGAPKARGVMKQTFKSGGKMTKAKK
jgi:hypothetical protein